MTNIRRYGLVRGVGINDVEGSPYTRDSESRIIHTCPFYSKWSSLLNRVYVYSQTDRGKAYDGCSVCEDWLTFSKFKKWMVNQDWEGREIDKDILGDGKIYSPDTCIFILPITNRFLINKSQYLGKYLQGVYFSEKESKYKGQYSDPFLKKRFVKSFDSEIDAHIFYLESKIQIADKIIDLEDDPRVKTYLYNFFRDKLKEVN